MTSRNESRASPNGRLMRTFLTGTLILDPSQRWISEWPSVNEKPHAPLWNDAGQSMIWALLASGKTIWTAYAASLMLSGCSSTSTQVLDRFTMELSFPYVRQGGAGNQLPLSNTWLMELLRTRGSRCPLTLTYTLSAGHFQTAKFLPK